MRLARRAISATIILEQILVIEREKGVTARIEDIRHLVAGSENRRVLQDGVMDAAAWSCGTVAGLIHDAVLQHAAVLRSGHEVADISILAVTPFSRSMTRICSRIMVAGKGPPGETHRHPAKSSGPLR